MSSVKTQECRIVAPHEITPSPWYPGGITSRGLLYFDLLDRKMALPPQIGSGTPIRTATCRIRVEIGVQWRLRVAVLRHGPLEFKQRGRPSQPSGVPISTGSRIAALCATSETPRRIDAVYMCRRHLVPFRSAVVMLR